LRQQIATLEKRNANLEKRNAEQEENFEVLGQLAEKERADLEAALQKRRTPISRRRTPISRRRRLISRQLWKRRTLILRPISRPRSSSSSSSTN
jgi:hypothetical protein